MRLIETSSGRARSAIDQSVSALRTGPYVPPGADVGSARGGGRLRFGCSSDRGAGAGSVRGGVGAGCCVGFARSGGDSGAGAGRLIAPPGVLGLAGRVWAGETAGGVAGAGSNTGGSRRTVYSRNRRPRAHVASTSNVTNGSMTGSREVTCTTERPPLVAILKSKRVRNPGRSTPYRSKTSGDARATFRPWSSSGVATSAICA